MKRIQQIMPVILILISASLSAQTVKKETIKVWGNCSSCKKHIEKAALSGGASYAEWNTTTKMLLISFDPSKVSEATIQKSIAAVGYDTEKYKGDDKAYSELEECCQYDRKKTSSSK